MSDAYMTRFMAAFRTIRRGFAVRETEGALRRQEGLTTDQTDILTLLNNAPAGCRMGEISQHLEADHANTARTVRALVARKYVQRKKFSGDGRGVVVVLTAAGQATAQRIRERRDRYYQAIMKEFPGAQRKHVIPVLEGLTKVLERVAGLARDDE